MKLELLKTSMTNKIGEKIDIKKMDTETAYNFTNRVNDYAETVVDNIISFDEAIDTIIETYSMYLKEPELKWNKDSLCIEEH